MLVPAHPHPFQHLILISLILAILIDVWWYFIVFFIYISLRLLMLSTFPCACLPSVYYFFFLVKCVEITCLSCFLITAF